jgi:hypothetical protein
MTASDDVQRSAAIERLLAKSELQDLAMRYARAIDRGDRDLLLSLYHDDAIDHHGAHFHGSPPEFADYVEQTAAPLEASAHYIVNSTYEIDGDRADGELYFVAYHRTHAPESTEIIVSGRYLDRYERRAGVWKIARRSVVWDWAEVGAMRAESRKLLGELGDGAGRRDDASYAALPLLARRK